MPIQEQRFWDRPHHLAPRLETARVALVCRDFGGNGVSHVGLRISADYTAKTLRRDGVWAEAWSVKSSADLISRLRRTHAIAVGQGDVRPSHIVVSAPWVESKDLAAMAEEFQEIVFLVVSHSSVGFLSADPHAIKILREVADMHMSSHNVLVGGNSQKFVDWATETWGVHAVYAPNLYDMSEVWDHKDRNWRPGTLLRLGLFGANRPLKNHIGGAAAAAELATKLGTPVTLHMSSGRCEGGSMAAINEMVAGVPNLTLKLEGWMPWPTFRRLVRTMDLVFQVSYTESFNVVTADAVAEGVPVVASDAIDWVPDWWKAASDVPRDLARVAERLLYDPTTGHQGRQALAAYVKQGLVAWRQFLGA